MVLRKTECSPVWLETVGRGTAYRRKEISVDYCTGTARRARTYRFFVILARTVGKRLARILHELNDRRKM